PQAKIYNYELEEELEEEKKDVNINYIYKNKENTSEQRIGMAYKDMFSDTSNITYEDVENKDSKLKKMFADKV
ncbi:MAG: hypothetical protein ACKVJA_01735, partial [Flavobacteriales bacterium]